MIDPCGLGVPVRAAIDLQGCMLGGAMSLPAWMAVTLEAWPWRARTRPVSLRIRPNSSATSRSTSAARLRSWIRAIVLLRKGPADDETPAVAELELAMNTVLLRRNRGAATLELNRPHRKNSLTTELVEESIAAVEDVARSVDDRVLVITGAGDSFCSGMDLSAPLLPDELTFMRRVGQLCSLVHNLPKPTIAKVNGPAMGFGANFALCCDLVVAGEAALFGEMFADLGISVDGGGTWSLPRRVGIAKAKELVFFGERISGQQAAELGIVNRAVPDEDLDGFVESWAERLASSPTLALSMMKSAINASFETSFEQAVEQEALAQSVAFRSREAREAGRARKEKRKPDFRNAAAGHRDGVAAGAS